MRYREAPSHHLFQRDGTRCQSKGSVPGSVLVVLEAYVQNHLLHGLNAALDCWRLVQKPIKDSIFILFSTIRGHLVAVLGALSCSTPLTSPLVSTLGASK